MAERQIELTWRCSSCGARNLGRHAVCQNCGNPKDESEEYEMPADTAAAASVVDPALLRVAKAGANWRCRYCGSDQRAFDGTCGQCGASQIEGQSTARAPDPVIAQPLPVRRRRAGFPYLFALLGALVAILMLCGMTAVLGRRRPLPPAAPAYVAVAAPPAYRDVEGTVQSVRWTHTLVIDRWQIVNREGFEDAKPKEAFEVRSQGQRVHHTEQVADGFNTETYSETVPDGFRTETYTEREPCGQDCKPRPQVCRENCRPNSNGFATCKTECTGGGTDCSPKTCTVQKTRQVPQTKTVQKTRQVPRFRDEPRYAAWYSWKVWDWAFSRQLEKTGNTLETSWPTDAEQKPDGGLTKGEKERVTKKPSYFATLDNDARSYEVTIASLDDFAKFTPLSRHALRIWNDQHAELAAGSQ